MLGMVRHQLAPELERVLAGRVRELVHEALEVDGVLVVVHAAPEPRRDVRIAHGVVDQQVRDGVAERAFRAAGIEALEGDRILAVLQAPRVDVRQDRLAGDAHVQRGQVVVGVERAGELALRDRMIARRCVMSSSRDQISLIGVPGICLGDARPRGSRSRCVPRRPKPPPSSVL